ncbi:Apolipophorins [Gryllus bimaculatus]|nr:Apolipophorins [Gryllus bimaculatus]
MNRIFVEAFGLKTGYVFFVPDRVEASTETTQENTVNESDVTNSNNPSETFNTISVPDGPLKCSTECSQVYLLAIARNVLGFGLSLRVAKVDLTVKNRSVSLKSLSYSNTFKIETDIKKLQLMIPYVVNRFVKLPLPKHSIPVVRAEVQERVSPPPREAWTSNARLSQLLQRRSLAFAYDDGRVDALCPAADEARWALNRDVSGLCLTYYERVPFISTRGRDVFKLSRSKDPAHCAHRSHVVLPLPSGSALPAAGAKSPLQGELNCNQLFEDGVLQEATCREMQTLRPFSVEVGPTTSLGATAHALQSLQLVNITDIPLGAEEGEGKHAILLIALHS